LKEDIFGILYNFEFTFYVATAKLKNFIQYISRRGNITLAAKNVCSKFDKILRLFITKRSVLLKI
jgi:hypothetical protein